MKYKLISEEDITDIKKHIIQRNGAKAIIILNNLKDSGEVKE